MTLTVNFSTQKISGQIHSRSGFTAGTYSRGDITLLIGNISNGEFSGSTRGSFWHGDDASHPSGNPTGQYSGSFVGTGGGEIVGQWGYTTEAREVLGVFYATD